MTFNQEQYYWVDYKANEKALIIQTWSGLGLTAVDHLYLPYILPLDTDNETLGIIVLQALKNSRTFVSGTVESKDFFDPTKRQLRYDAWVSYLCEQIGYKNKRALFRNMIGGSIFLYNGHIKISSTRHVKLEAWEGMKDVGSVILTLDNTPEEIGAGLRLALSRCR